MNAVTEEFSTLQARDLKDHTSVGSLSVLPLRNGPQLVLVVRGEADVSTAAHLRNSLLAALAFTPEMIVVDVSGLTFCSLAGLDALNEAAVAAQTAGISLQLRGVSRWLSWMHRSFPAQPADLSTPPAQPAAPLVLPEQSRQ